MKFVTSLLFLIVIQSTFVTAQNADDTVKIETKPVPVYTLDDKVQQLLMELESKKPNQNTEQNEVKSFTLDELDKTVLARIADIYRLHVLSLDAQINNDALSAEKYIQEGLSAMQEMLEENQEYQQNKRFAELYRTVMTEYRSFYGLKDGITEEEGEIFAVQNELFSDDEMDKSDLDTFMLPENVNNTNFQVPLPQNRYVNNHIAYLWLKRPEIMETWLKRKEKYFPMMEKIFEEENVPKELMHLAMIESGLNPSARSRAAAVGMWQFIKATGSVYGLEVNWWVDERRDPIQATRAAAQHLRDLYKYWGDWHLALANYNVSPRRMKYAIRRSNGVKDYWVIYPYLPRETRGYVPSFIATTMIATNPEEFGFKKKYDEKPFAFETVDIKGSYDLSVLAECAGISTQVLKEYNTSLLRWATPPGDEPFELKLPVGTKKTFLAKFKNVPKSETPQLFVHEVRSGESIGLIARKYGVSVRDIYQANSKLGKVIYPGQEIVVPIPAGSNNKLLASLPSIKSSVKRSSSSSRNYSSKPANSVRLTYKVKKSDTIGHIAEYYDTQAWKIRSWNNVGNLIRVGQKLKVYVPASRKSKYASVNSMSYNERQELLRSKKRGSTKVSSKDADNYIIHTVRRNDNLSDIASSYGVSISRIKKLNSLRRNTIYPGQKLKIKEK